MTVFWERCVRVSTWCCWWNFKFQFQLHNSLIVFEIEDSTKKSGSVRSGDLGGHNHLKIILSLSPISIPTVVLDIRHTSPCWIQQNCIIMDWCGLYWLFLKKIMTLHSCNMTLHTPDACLIGTQGYILMHMRIFWYTNSITLKILLKVEPGFVWRMCYSKFQSHCRWSIWTMCSNVIFYLCWSKSSCILCMP